MAGPRIPPEATLLLMHEGWHGTAVAEQVKSQSIPYVLAQLNGDREFTDELFAVIVGLIGADKAVTVREAAIATRAEKLERGWPAATQKPAVAS